MSNRLPAAALAAALLAGGPACADQSLRAQALSLFGRLEPVTVAPADAPKVALGQALF